MSKTIFLKQLSLKNFKGIKDSEDRSKFDIQPLEEIERLELSLKYSVSEKHKESLLKRINKLKSGQLNMFVEVQINKAH